MVSWLATLQQTLNDASPSAVLVTVARVRGSAPREVGARMIVTADALIGTIGGGQLEYQCQEIALRRLDATNEQRELRNFPLGANCGQCCGGVVDVLFETVRRDTSWLTQAGEHRGAVLVTPLDSQTPRSVWVDAREPDVLASACKPLLAGAAPAAYVQLQKQAYLLEAVGRQPRTVAVFGAGHVGAALVRVLATLDYRIEWIDSRAQLLAAQEIDGVHVRCTARPTEHAAGLPPGSHCIVMTHSHALDFDICAALLARDDLGFVGLIGSASKRQRFARLSRQMGMPEEQLERLTCPIGIEGITGKAPGEIAVAVAAQLLGSEAHVEEEADAALHP